MRFELLGGSRSIARLADDREDHRELVLHPMIDFPEQDADTLFRIAGSADIPRDFGRPDYLPVIAPVFVISTCVSELGLIVKESSGLV